MGERSFMWLSRNDWKMVFLITLLTHKTIFYDNFLTLNAACCIHKIDSLFDVLFSLCSLRYIVRSEILLYCPFQLISFSIYRFSFMLLGYSPATLTVSSASHELNQIQLRSCKMRKLNASSPVLQDRRRPVYAIKCISALGC